MIGVATKVESRTEADLPEAVLASIEALVRQRNARPSEIEGPEAEAKENAASPWMRDRQRNLEAMWQQAIYMLRISVSVGCSTLKVDYKDLDLKPEVLESLETNRVKPGTMTVFEALEQAANEIRYACKKIQKKYLVYVEPFWFCSEKDLEAVSQEIEGMRSQCEALCEEVLTGYRDGYESFLRRVTAILYAAGLRDEDLANAQETYSGAFPSYHKIRTHFRVNVEWGGRVPSILEAAEGNAALSESVVRKLKAKTETQALEGQLRALKDQERLAREAASRESEAVRRLQREHESTVRNAFRHSIGQARTQIESLIGEALSAIEAKTDGTIHAHTKRKLEANLARMETLLSFDSSLAELVKQVGAVQNLAFQAEGGQAEQLTERLAAMRQLMEQEHQITFADKGKGHRAAAARNMLL